MDQKHHLKNPHLRNQIPKMKFFALSVAAVFALFAQTMAEPLPQGIPPSPRVICPTDPDSEAPHCGGPCRLTCPEGWRCCGPITEEFGGTCFEGPGICAL